MNLQASKEFLQPENRPSLFELALSLIVGLFSRLKRATFSNQQDNDRKRVAEFYEKNRYVEGEEEIIDAAAGWYSEFAFQALPNSAIGGSISAELWDLGCGQSTLLEWLASKGISVESYVGIDVYISQRQRKMQDANRRFLEFDMREDFAHLIAKANRIIVAVNSLCYIKNLKEVGAINHTYKNSNTSEKLFVAEPYPSIYWETHFSGIDIFLRYPQRIATELSCIGWNVVEVRKLYLYKFIGIYLFPIAYSVEFSK